MEILQIITMERINGETRDREKTMRGLKIKDTAILICMQIFYNYIRLHEGLGGELLPKLVEVS